MKRIICMLLVLLMAISMAACGPKGTTLNVVTSYGGDDGNRKNYEEAIAAYEKETGNKIKDDSDTSNEEWKARVLTSFQTGSEPDVLFFFSNADAEALIKDNKVVSIEEIRKEYPNYASNMKDSMLAVASDGKNYAVPSAGFWENMFVNKKVLADAGVAVPGPDYTWDQFLADCQKIKDKGYAPIGCSLMEVPHYWFEFCVMNNGGMDTQLELPELDADGKLVMNDVAKKWIAALEDIKDLYERGYFPENTLTAKDEETVGMVQKGQAAFLIDGSWKVGNFVENCPDNLEDFTVCCVPGKGDRKATEAIGGISMGWFITRKAWDDPAKRDAAIKLIEHMTSDKTISKFVTTEVTALKNPAAPEGLNYMQQQAANNNGNITGVVGAVQDTLEKAARESLFAAVSDIVKGDISPADAIEAALKLNVPAEG